MTTNQVTSYASFKSNLGLELLPWVKSINNETGEEFPWWYFWNSGNKILIHNDHYQRLTADMPVTLVHKCDCERDDGSVFSTFIMFTYEGAK